MWIKTYQKNGKRSGKQRYRCNDCGYIFENNRRKSINLAAQLWDQYVNGNQTINSLCKHYDISPKRVRRVLDNFEIKSREIIPVKCILIMDTSYFRRGFGVMVFRCHQKHQNMFWKFVDHETVAKYQSRVSYLQSKGRITRIGQEHPTFVIKFYSTELEKRMYENFEKKVSLHGLIKQEIINLKL